MSKFKIGDIITCTNVIDYRFNHNQKMRYIHLGHEYYVMSINPGGNVYNIRDIQTDEMPGFYSEIFFSKTIELNKRIKVI